MANGWGYPYQARAIDQAAYDAGLRQYMLSIYNYMAGGLAVTGLFAILLASSPEGLALVFGTPLRWLVILAPLGFVFFLSARINTMSVGTAQFAFWAFCAIMGLSMASLFIVYTHTSIARVFFITASVFGATSLWGYTTRSDLTKMGHFMMMGLFGIVIASVINIFLGSTGLQFLISIVGVVVFTGLTAWDTQRLKEQYDSYYGPEVVRKGAIMGALTLYLDFINLFVMLLRLVGQRND